MLSVISLLIAVLGMASGMLLALGVHETGHLIGGRLGGLRPALLIVGPLHLQMGDAGTRWTLNRSAGSAGGVASAVPWRASNLARAYGILTLGGPLASLVVGALAIGGYFALGFEFGAGAAQRHSLFYGFVSAGWLVFAVSSIGIGAITLLPLRYAGLTQDGARFLLLRRGGAIADRQAALLALGACAAAGRRPREWDAPLIAQAVAIADGSFDDALGRYQAYLQALDTDDVAAAGGHVRYLIGHQATIPKSFLPVLCAEAAYFLAAYDRDAAAARAFAARIERSPFIDGHTRRRIDAALLYVEGHAAHGAQAVRAAMSALEKIHGVALADFWIAELVRMSQRQAPAGAVRTGLNAHA